MRGVASACAAAALIGCAGPVADRPQPRLLRFWVALDADTTAFPDSIDLFDHPCGATADVLTTSTLPPIAGLEGETVAELRAGGGIVRSWTVPVDYVILGVIGDRLVLQGRPPIAVSPDGAFAPIPDYAEAASTPVPCPEQEAIVGSDYLRCATFGTDPARLIAFEGPCT